jgi:pimeloyl-ACP methyl ester carboxylesterase
LDRPREGINIDLRVGRRYELTMVQPDGGGEFGIGYEIVELVEPELIVLRSDPMPEVGMHDPTITRLEFHDHGAKTRMTLSDGPYPAGATTPRPGGPPPSTTSRRLSPHKTPTARARTSPRSRSALDRGGAMMTGDRPAATDVNAVIDATNDRAIDSPSGGVETFVLDLGHGQPVVCLHGVPASSFLYRKLIVELAARGLRGIAFDLPGLGLAERPAAFDHTWTGLGRFASAAVEALDLDRFHLVVHDIGAPVGFELAAAHPGRVASLTVLNAPVEVDTFTARG